MFDVLRRIHVTQEFIDHRNYIMDKLDTHGRDERKMMISCDALLPEFTLIDLRPDFSPVHMGHDIIIDGEKIDIKVIRDKYFTVRPEKLEWYNKCYHERQLDTFLFLHQVEGPKRPFEVGDIVSYEFCRKLEANKVLYNLRKSRYCGYYFTVKE